MVATNLIMSIVRVAPREDDFKEHKHTLLIDDIQAIAAIKPSQKHNQIKFLLFVILAMVFNLNVTKNNTTLKANTPYKGRIM